MSNLVLELHAGDAMIVNGASLRFRTRSRIELTTHARFLFGKQIMAPEEADSPARRIYFALQLAYIGAGEERERDREQVRATVADFRRATTSQLAREILDRIVSLMEADDCYAALKLARRIVRHEDSVLGRTDPAPAPRPSRAPASAQASAKASAMVQ